MRRAIPWMLLALLAGGAVAEAADPAYTVTCDLARGRLVAPVSINGAPGYSALVDAGLMAPVISNQAVAALGMVADADGSVALTGFDLSPRLGFEGRAATGDFAAITEALGQNVDAIAPLHQPGLEVTLDLGQGRVVYRPLDKALLGNTGDGTLPLRLQEGTVPIVQVLIDGKYQRELLLDLAYPGTVSLSEETLQAMGLLAANPAALHTVNADGRSSVQFRLPDIRIGTTTMTSPIGEMAPGPERIGLGALQYFEVTLNYEAGLIRCVSNAGAVIPAQGQVGYGLSLARLRAGQWELAVAEDSPASEAGIVPGAILAGIGNSPLRKTDHATTGRLLRAVPGAEIVVTVVQGGTPQAYTLVARPLL